MTDKPTNPASDTSTGSEELPKKILEHIAYAADTGDHAQATDDIMQLVRQSNRELLERLKAMQINHFTAWGGKQGTCAPEDVIDELLATLQEHGDTRG